IAVQVVREGWARLNRDLSTREVTMEMKRRGVKLQLATTYGLMLKALSKSSTRGALGWRAPQIVQTNFRNASGRTVKGWRPAGTAPSNARPATDSTDAVVIAIQDAERALGRPVSKRELILWSESHAATHHVALFLRTSG